MKKIIFCTLFTITTQLLFAQVWNLPDPKQEKIVASYLITFARLPRTDEINYWKSQPDITMKQHIENRRQWMVNNDKKEMEGAIRSSYATIFGRAPKQEEIDYWKKQNYVFAELIGFQTDFLKSNKAEWESVIKQSYVVAFSKYLKNTDQEFTYWQSQKPIPFAELVRKHMEFKSKNGYRVQSTVDFSKPIIAPDLNQLTFAMVPFSQALKQEIPKYLASSYVNAVISTGGGNVISTGGGNVISTGGGNVISTGGGNVISTGGGNVITFGNGNVISTGGGNLIRQ